MLKEGNACETKRCTVSANSSSDSPFCLTSFSRFSAVAGGSFFMLGLSNIRWNGQGVSYLPIQFSVLLRWSKNPPSLHSHQILFTFALTIIVFCARRSQASARLKLVNVSSNGCNGLLPSPGMGVEVGCLKLLLVWWFLCKAWPEHDELWQLMIVFLRGVENLSHSAALCCRFTSTPGWYSLGLSPWLFNISVLWSWYACTYIGVVPSTKWTLQDMCRPFSHVWEKFSLSPNHLFLVLYRFKQKSLLILYNV